MKQFIMLVAIFCIMYTASAQVSVSKVERNHDADYKRNRVHSQVDFFSSPNGDEFLIDKSSGFSRAPGDQQYAAAAFDGKNYFVVWSDTRDENYDIYGARVTKEGIVLDSSGIAISTAPNYQENPKVAFDGINFLVVWSDLRNGYPDYNIYGARVSRDGILLDSSGIAISTTPNRQERPSVAFDGTNYFVVWDDIADLSPDFNVYGARVSPSGEVMDTASIQLSFGTTGELQPSIAYDGTNYLVVWTDYRYGANIYGTRVSPAGVILDTTDIPICTNFPTEETQPTIAFNDTNFLVVWSVAWPNYDIHGVRISPSGIVLDTNGIVLSNAGGYQISPSVTSDGNNFFIAWRDFRAGNDDIYGTRVSAAGVLLDTDGIPLRINPTIEEWMPSIMYSDTTYFLVWSHNTPPDYTSGEDVYGVRVSSTGSILDSSGICISTRNVVVESWEPTVAFDDTNYLVVWESYSGNDPTNIRGVRVNSNGTILDPTGFDICTDEGDQYYPSLAFGKTNYLVVWDDRGGSDDDIEGALVNRDGTIYQTLQICGESDDQNRPRVAFGDTNFFVVWRDWRGTGTNIYGARVTQDGSVLDYNGFPIYDESGTDQDPNVSFDGMNYLVVWVHSDDIYGCRISSNGDVLDPEGFVISDAVNDQRRPAIAFDGINYLVVWHDKRNNDTNDIYAARVTPAGIVLDTSGIAICTAPNDQEYPSIVFDGTNYVISWDDYRHNADTSDIYGAMVNTAGIILKEVPIINQTGESFSPMLTRGNGNEVFLVYNLWTGDYSGTPYNAFRVWGKYDPLTVGVNEPPVIVPSRYALYQNYPNPFNPSTTIHFELPKESHVTLKVYNLLGQEVMILVNEDKKLGRYEVSFDGSKLPSGVYFYRLSAGEFIQARKLLLIK